MATATGSAIRLSPAIVAALLAHAERELPHEACGLLAGDASLATVGAFHPARNEHASRYRFSVDPRDLVRITYAIEAAGQELVAIFHSHPAGEAKPSATDLREAGYPMALHVLAGREDKKWSLRAWRISDGTSAEVAIARG